jgi:hypothetical protein
MTDFEEWYAVYPRKEARKDALKAWSQLSPDTETQQAMHDALRWQIPLHGWDQPSRRRFCPLPASYLRGERWTDQAPASQPRPVPTADDLAIHQAMRERDRLNAVERGRTFQPWKLH